MATSHLFLPGVNELAEIFERCKIYFAGIGLIIANGGPWRHKIRIQGIVYDPNLISEFPGKISGKIILPGMMAGCVKELCFCMLDRYERYTVQLTNNILTFDDGDTTELIGKQAFEWIGRGSGYTVFLAVLAEAETSLLTPQDQRTLEKRLLGLKLAFLN